RSSALPRIRAPALDPVHSALDRRVPVWVVRPALRFDSSLSAEPYPVLDLAFDGIFQDHPVRTRGMRADRWREPLSNLDENRPAAGGARADFRFHLLFHAVLERIYLRAHLHFVDRAQDRAGGDR